MVHHWMLVSHPHVRNRGTQAGRGHLCLLLSVKKGHPTSPLLSTVAPPSDPTCRLTTTCGRCGGRLAALPPVAGLLPHPSKTFYRRILSPPILTSIMDVVTLHRSSSVTIFFSFAALLSAPRCTPSMTGHTVALTRLQKTLAEELRIGSA
jgi:hypothetical protein